MQRLGAYSVAVVVIVALIGAITWALKIEPLNARALQTVQGTRFEAVPVGADGALKPCLVCHSVERGGALRVAPPLYGIIGAHKARAEWYGYSPALQKADGTWTEADLDKFLASPSKFLPGTSKTIIGIADAKRRADIIAALKNAP